jgi:hypothetical protein
MLARRGSRPAPQLIGLGRDRSSLLLLSSCLEPYQLPARCFFQRSGPQNSKSHRRSYFIASNRTIGRSAPYLFVPKASGHGLDSVQRTGANECHGTLPPSSVAVMAELISMPIAFRTDRQIFIHLGSPSLESKLALLAPTLRLSTA